jgi:glycosyltransferase involved in cell wall biosynthesis
MSRMQILIALTYYRPHISGLTVYAERLARGLARAGHGVTVLTSRYDARLPAREQIDGVEIVRVPVRLKVSKGVIMPAFPFYAAAAIAHCDVVNIHMPQFEAALLAFLGRVYRKRVVVTYHCDLRLPAGAFNQLVRASLRPLNRLAAWQAHAIVATTDDYARHSRFLSRSARKLTTIAPLVEMPPVNPAITQRLADRWQLNGGTRIGFAARFAAEKGVETLLQALPRIVEHIPDVRLIFTGAYKDTVGEEEYLARLAPLLERYADRLTFLNLLATEEMPSFYALCDAVAVTSLNSTEAFGLVQVEAMLTGTPVVASDLPGVREPVRATGMGELVPPRDPPALAAALVRVLQGRQRYVRPRAEIARAFDLERAVVEYEALFAARPAAG